MIDDARPLIGHALRKDLIANLFHEGRGSARTDTRSARAIDGNGVGDVVVGQIVWASSGALMRERGERNHFSIAVDHIQLAEIFRRHAVARVRLHVHLIHLIESIELVDVCASEIQLQHRERVSNGHA